MQSRERKHAFHEHILHLISRAIQNSCSQMHGYSSSDGMIISNKFSVKNKNNKVMQRCRTLAVKHRSIATCHCQIHSTNLFLLNIQHYHLYSEYIGGGVLEFNVIKKQTPATIDTPTIACIVAIHNIWAKTDISYFLRSQTVFDGAMGYLIIRER